MQTLMRMTSDDPECITRHLNVFFAQGGDGYVRSGGPGNRDMELTAWIREAAGNIRAEIYAEDNECLCDELYDNLMYGIEEPEGVVAYLYLAALQAIEMRGRLKKIEDILGDTYDLDRLRELVQADREGRVYILPCRIGDPIYIIRRYKDGGGFVSKRKVVGAHLKDEFYRKSIPRKEYLVTRFEDYSMHIPMDWIGKRAFFDKKSAEKALEEMEGNGNG